MKTNFLGRLKNIWSVPSEGFGDTIAKITKTFGISPCDGCEKRRVKFNDRIAYKKAQRP